MVPTSSTRHRSQTLNYTLVLQLAMHTCLKYFGTPPLRVRLNAVLTQLHRHCLVLRHRVNHYNAEEAHVKVAKHLSLLKQVQITECGSEVGTPLVCTSQAHYSSMSCSGQKRLHLPMALTSLPHGVALLTGFLGRVAKKTCIAHQHENTTLVSYEALPTWWLKIYSE